MSAASRAGAAALVFLALTVGCAPALVDRGPRQTPLGRIVSASGLRNMRLQSAVQEAIRACMRRRGFRYIPRNTKLEFASAPAYELSRDDFMTAYGYGITTAGEDETAFEVPQAPDPNRQLARSLSPARRRAFIRALWGTPRVAKTVLRDGEQLAQWFPSSCVTKANTAVLGPQKEALENSLTINELLAELNDNISKDRRIIEVKLAWSACMNERGRAFETPTEIRTHLGRRYQRLIGASRSVGHPGVRREERMDRPMDELRGVEYAIAKDDMACRDQTRFDDVIYAVRTAYEIDFVRRNHHLVSHVWPVPASVLSDAMSSDGR